MSVACDCCLLLLRAEAGLRKIFVVVRVEKGEPKVNYGLVFFYAEGFWSSL